MNPRQVKLVNRLLDGFDGKLATGKWAAIAECSPDSALRDINELVALGVLRKAAAGGRSTHYELATTSPAPPPPASGLSPAHKRRSRYRSRCAVAMPRRWWRRP